MKSGTGGGGPVKHIPISVGRLAPPAQTEKPVTKRRRGRNNLRVLRRGAARAGNRPGNDTRRRAVHGTGMNKEADRAA